MQYIGKIDKQKIGYYANKISNDEIVLTEERKLHIYEEHKKDYQLIMENIKNGVLNPNEVLKDNKNKDTLFFISKIDKNNLNVVIKLNTTNNEEHPNNSIMTAWLIRDSNLKKLREKNEIIYKSE
ncbi:MAG: hypothetical protein HFJ50_02720 [Clostridia bacterium]|nr:hypothetical protein [Clostridia bacterium]